MRAFRGCNIGVGGRSIFLILSQPGGNIVPTSVRPKRIHPRPTPSPGNKTMAEHKLSEDNNNSE